MHRASSHPILTITAKALWFGVAVFGLSPETPSLHFSLAEDLDTISIYMSLHLCMYAWMYVCMCMSRLT